MCSLSTTHCDNKVMGEKPVTTRTRRWRCGGRRASDVGVKRVETYFVPSRPSWESDIAIKEEIRATLIADPALVSGRVDIAVFAGHVVLIGVVDSRANVEKLFQTRVR